MQSIFAAGSDMIRQMVAEREADRMIREDRARREQLDADARANRAEDVAFRDRQLKSVDDDRDEARRIANVNAELKKKNDTDRDAAIQAYMTATTPEERERARVILEARHGVHIEAPPKPVAPTTHTVAPGGALVGADGKVIYQAPPAATKTSKATPAQIMNAGRTALRDAQAEMANGTLPQGVTVQQRATELRDQYLEDLGVDDTKVRQSAPPPMVAGPGSTLAVGDGPGVVGHTPSTGHDIRLPGPGAPPAAAPPRYALPPSGPAPVAAPPSGRASGAGPVGGPAAPSDEALQAQAVQILNANGKQVSPETIAIVIQRLKAAGGSR